MTKENQETKNPDKKDKTEKTAQLKEPSETGEFFRTIFVAIILALIIRTFLYEPFNIPSGSMLPTLKVGDYLFVFKPSYGYSKHSFPFSLGPFEGRILTRDQKPEPGDVIVFKLPTNPRVDYIKRVVGMPGDRIQMIGGRLYINDTLIPRKPMGFTNVEKFPGFAEPVMEYEQTLPNGVKFSIYEDSDDDNLDNTELFTVPEDHYFVMGDNRDNSQDSRVQSLVGFVPYNNVVGEADFIFFSLDESFELLKPWGWPFAVRYGRIFDKIGPDQTDIDQSGS